MQYHDNHGFVNLHESHITNLYIVNLFVREHRDFLKSESSLFTHYDLTRRAHWVDDDEVKTVLRLSEYGERDEMGWVLLEREA